MSEYVQRYLEGESTMPILRDAEAEIARLQEELRIARWDADVPIRELREEIDRLREELRLAEADLKEKDNAIGDLLDKAEELGYE